MRYGERDDSCMLIDTNIILEILLKQQKAQTCFNFLEKVRSGEINALVSTFTLDSILIELQRNNYNAEFMRSFILSLLSHKGLKIYMPSIDDRLKAIAHLALGLDFEDALTLQCAISSNEDEIMSFDKDFDKIKSIKRVQPPLPGE